MSKVYGYVLLPIAFEVPTTGGEPTEDRIDETVERLWDDRQFDLEGSVEHFREDGGFPPTFVESHGEQDAVRLLATKLRLTA